MEISKIRREYLALQESLIETLGKFHSLKNENIVSKSLLVKAEQKIIRENDPKSLGSNETQRAAYISELTKEEREIVEEQSLKLLEIENEISLIREKISRCKFVLKTYEVEAQWG